MCIDVESVTTRHSLLFRDGLVAAVTHSHLKLKAHEGDGGALGGALPAHRLPALPTVVLERREKDEGHYSPLVDMERNRISTSK